MWSCLRDLVETKQYFKVYPFWNTQYNFISLRIIFNNVAISYFVILSVDDIRRGPPHGLSSQNNDMGLSMDLCFARSLDNYYFVGNVKGTFCFAKADLKSLASDYPSCLQILGLLAQPLYLATLKIMFSILNGPNFYVFKLYYLVYYSRPSRCRHSK